VEQPASAGRKKRLSIVLSAIFLLAVVMGAGPGVYLVNPNPADPDAVRTFLGVPIVYAWTVFWFFVQAGVVLAAYLLLWTGPAVSGPKPHHAANENPHEGPPP